jgi:hypothetical protein
VQRGPLTSTAARQSLNRRPIAAFEQVQPAHRLARDCNSSCAFGLLDRFRGISRSILFSIVE